jgi:hypothetical protein
MVHGIIGEKGSELPDGDPRKKHKWRAVLLGDRVYNQDFETATFAVVGSSPTTSNGGSLVDAYGCGPGNCSQGADVAQAFCQAPMLTEVLAGLPPEAVQDPDWCYQVPDPVVLLILALYGHPDSPTFWEVHCAKLVRSKGRKDIGPEWHSVFRHPELCLQLSVHVDDFKMSGPMENIAAGWSLLRDVIDMKDLAPATLYLGCEQSQRTL